MSGWIAATTGLRSTVECCVHQLFEAQVERNSDAVAVSWGEQTLTYAELNRRANQLAHYLVELGAGPDVPVGVALRPSLNLPVALLAVLKAGGVCLPLDPAYPEDRLRAMLDEGRPIAILTEKQLAGAFAFASLKLLCLDNQAAELFRGDDKNLISKAAPDHLAYIIFTSGSTGKPRGVLLPHRGLANHHQAAIELYDLQRSDRVLQFSSISFDIAIEEIFPILICGGTVVLKASSLSLQAGEFLQWCEEQGITVLDLPTAFWHELVHQLEATPGIALPRSLRMVILGGEKASTKTYRAWQNFAEGKVRLINTYGPTEASIIVAAFEPPSNPQEQLGDCLPLGRAFGNATLHVLDQQLKSVTNGDPGELYIGGPGLARGYLNQPEVTGQKFIPDPFASEPGARLYKTGDMARCGFGGNLEFLGRIDYQVKIRGFRVEPGEIEAVLNKYPGVAESLVVAREDGGDKYLAAYLVWTSGKAEASNADLRKFVGGTLPEYMVPSAFMTLDRLPLTPNGKVDRKALPKPSLAPVSARQRDDAPQDALQAQLVSIWESVLGHRPIGIHDSFFEVGGQSLSAARLMHRMGQALGKPLPLVMLLESPTIAKISAALRQDGWLQHWSSLVPIQPCGSKPPFFCVHGVGGNVLGLHVLARLMAPDQPFYGLQAQGLDGKSPCLPTIEEMAAYYIAQIRSVQPEGPYFLGGYSLGGLIAYEMAQQLRVQSQEVAMVALLDTYPGDLKSERKSLLRLLVPTREHVLRDWPEIIRKIYLNVEQTWTVPRELKNVFRSNKNAADRYVLKLYSGKVVLFRALEKSARVGDESYALWNELVSGLETHLIPGDHRGILFDPQVQELAENLKSRINEVASEYEHC